MSEFPAARRIRLPDRVTASGAREPGLTLSVHEAGSGPAVVLCHGFPELAYSWRHQIPAIAAAGFRVIAPDQRGYGGSDAPEPVEAYGMEQLTGDLAGLLQALGVERAIFVGHDWGGFVSWAMPVLYPHLAASAIGVNTPYIPFPTTEFLRQLFTEDERLYILWFQQPGVAEGVLDRNPRMVFEKIMRRGVAGRGGGMLQGGREGRDANPFRRLESFEPSGATLLTETEIDVYAKAFAARGFRGPVSWYRNVDANRARFPDVSTRPISLPCLMITAEWDAALPPALAQGMSTVCSDLETHMIAGCGHWTQQEKPEELNRLLVDWLVRRFK
jgi:pimeloyl-ACP methyl ester carboxylesterase